MHSDSFNVEFYIFTNYDISEMSKTLKKLISVQILFHLRNVCVTFVCVCLFMCVCACVCVCALACLIKPKSQTGNSYLPNLVLILIILGLANKIKFLAVPEVRQNLTSFWSKYTKDLQNI